MVPPTPTLISFIHSPFNVIQHVQIANISVLKSLLKPVPQIDKLIEESKCIIQKYGSKVLYKLPDDGILYSSKNIRVEPNTFAKFICDCIRQYSNSDIACVPGGKIRGNKDYTNRLITYLDVLTELPFSDNQIITIKTTGELIQRTLQYSEENHIGRGGYLQVDNDVIFTDDTRMYIKFINKKTFNPNYIYTFSVPLTHLKGIDNNAVLVEIGQQNNINNIMKDDLPLLQHMLVQYFSSGDDGTNTVNDAGGPASGNIAPVIP